MSNKTTQEMIDVMEASIKGAEIEIFEGMKWTLVYKPAWNWGDNEYRIKPQKTKRLLTSMELFERGATHVKKDLIRAITEFSDKYLNCINYDYTIEELKEHDFKWTSDRITWNSFEIEVEE